MDKSFWAIRFHAGERRIISWKICSHQRQQRRTHAQFMLWIVDEFICNHRYLYIWNERERESVLETFRTANKCDCLLAGDNFMDSLNFGRWCRLELINIDWVYIWLTLTRRDTWREREGDPFRIFFFALVFESKQLEIQSQSYNWNSKLFSQRIHPWAWIYPLDLWLIHTLSCVCVCVYYMK